jgi:hypothetical protein
MMAATNTIQATIFLKVFIWISSYNVGTASTFPANGPDAQLVCPNNSR